MALFLSIDDFRRHAMRRIPRAIFDYADGGSYDERTMRRNAADLDAMAFRQRVMVDMPTISLATTSLGSPGSMPLAIGPTRLAGFFHAEGESLGTRAPPARGTPFSLSPMAF